MNSNPLSTTLSKDISSLEYIKKSKNKLKDK